MSKMVLTTIYMSEEQALALATLSRVTKVSRAAHVRAGIDLLLDSDKYANLVAPPQLALAFEAEAEDDGAGLVD